MEDKCWNCQYFKPEKRINYFMVKKSKCFRFPRFIFIDKNYCCGEYKRSKYAEE